jgi:hypothetical protein
MDVGGSRSPFTMIRRRPSLYDTTALLQSWAPRSDEKCDLDPPTSINRGSLESLFQGHQITQIATGST